jgi:predicted Zn-dependent protease
MGGQMGVARYSVAFEQEADYVGMYFMARAGYDPSGVADFWRRMAAEGESSITQRTSHPTSPERFLTMERTYGEIAAKKSRGQPLVPNLQRQ